MWELKVYKQLTVVKLRDWTQIITPVTVDDLLKASNSWLQFIKIWWVMVNINQIATAKEKKGNTVDNFILWFDREIQTKLNEIIEYKRAKWEKINIDTLKNAYKRVYDEEL